MTSGEASGYDFGGAGLPEVRCTRSEFGPVLADFRAAPWAALDPLFLRLNLTGEVPEQSTSVRVGCDEKALRVLFVASDVHPWATFTERDEPLYKEEVVEIFLDPEGDGLSYFEFEVNPNNAVLDAVMRRVRSGYRKDFRWRCAGLETAVQLFTGGWAAEIAIPFDSVCSSLPVSGSIWRINFTRIDRPEGRPRELSAWSPTGLAQFHIPQKFGALIFC